MGTAERENAELRRRVRELDALVNSPDGAISHTDHGARYTSKS